MHLLIINVQMHDYVILHCHNPDHTSHHRRRRPAHSLTHHRQQWPQSIRADLGSFHIISVLSTLSQNLQMAVEVVNQTTKTPLLVHDHAAARATRTLLLQTEPTNPHQEGVVRTMAMAQGDGRCRESSLARDPRRARGGTETETKSRTDRKSVRVKGTGTVRLRRILRGGARKKMQATAVPMALLLHRGERVKTCIRRGIGRGMQMEEGAEEEVSTTADMAVGVEATGTMGANPAMSSSTGLSERDTSFGT